MSSIVTFLLADPEFQRKRDDRLVAYRALGCTLQHERRPLIGSGMSPLESITKAHEFHSVKTAVAAYKVADEAMCSFMKKYIGDEQRVVVDTIDGIDVKLTDRAGVWLEGNERIRVCDMCKTYAEVKELAIDMAVACSVRNVVGAIFSNVIAANA
eukprot:gene19574-26258_t